MQAVRFMGVGRPALIEDVPKPSPGPGQILIRIGGAGVCHSDLHVMEEDLGFTPPFTLGHENAGWVAALGEGVTGFKDGDAVAVYGPWGCGRCHACQLSMENYCENWAQVDGFGGGLGLDGGMAEYMLVPSPRLLVPLANLSPAKAAPLSDAALTPYHAIKRALPHLNAESTVVVLGVGGLGHMPSAKGLIHRASAQSGGGGNPPSLEQSRELSRRIIAELGVKDIASLQRVEWARLNEVGNAVVAKMNPPLPAGAGPIPDRGTPPRVGFGPTVDGKVVTMRAFFDGAPEISKQVPMLIGSVSEEGNRMS